MASEVGVKKTLLALALFRADPKPCPKDEIETLVALLDAGTTKCSPPNVQACKQWALAHLVESSARRVGPFLEYLVALANSFRDDGPSGGIAAKSRVPSARRRRLHILYILNDIIHHVKFRLHGESFIKNLEPTLPLLVRIAASFSNKPKQISKIRGLISLWKDKGYFGDAFIDQLRTSVEEGVSSGGKGKDGSAGQGAVPSATTSTKPVPFNLPKRHGDLATPWYDLPPGNWLPWIDGRYPLDPNKIAPVEFTPGPASEEVVDAVTKLLANVNRLYSKEAQPDDPLFTTGEMGELIEKDVNGEITGGDTYYGWSRGFCQKMISRERDRRARTKEEKLGSRGRTLKRGRSPTVSPSRSLSSTPAHREHRHRSISIASSTSSGQPRFYQEEPGSRIKRRRYSQTPSHSRSSSRGSAYHGGHGSRGASENRSQAGHRSNSGFHRQEPWSKSVGYGQSRSRSPQRSIPGGLPLQQLEGNMYPGNGASSNFHTTQHMPVPIPQGVPPPPPAYGNFPVPPPQHPNFQGQWQQPAPPSTFGAQASFSGGRGQHQPPFNGGWNQTHQYPHQPQFQPQQHHNNFQQGHGMGRGRGRGGYGQGGRGW